MLVTGLIQRTNLLGVSMAVVPLSLNAVGGFVSGITVPVDGGFLSGEGFEAGD